MALCPTEGGKVVTEQPHPLRELSVSNTTSEAAVSSGVGTAPLSKQVPVLQHCP